MAMLMFVAQPLRLVNRPDSRLAVANGQYFGGGMHIAPEAELDDGLFDVVGIEGIDPLWGTPTMVKSPRSVPSRANLRTRPSPDHCST